jgi:Sec-independent protein translocase protein TatA
MLGVGYQELFLIGLAALLLFGPGKLPEVMGQAGKWYKQFRDVTSELTGEFEKTVAEAKSEMGDLGLDLGPMQKQVNSITKSVQKDLGGTGKKTTTTGSKAKSTTGSKSTSSKSTSASKSTGKTTSSRTSTGASATRTNTSKPNMTTGKPVVVASKEDPYASISMFEQAERKPKRRARAATPSIFTDPTPRDIEAMEPAVDTPKANAPAGIVIDADDPIARARQRRLKAGYAQATA